MNIDDESFPSTYLDISNVDSFFCNSLPSMSKCEKNSSEDHSQRSIIGLQTTSSTTATTTPLTDSTADGHDLDTNIFSSATSEFKLKPVKFRRSAWQRKTQSCESLNRVPTGKYDHVPSKVKIYIDAMKEQSKKQKKMQRHRSMPMIETHQKASLINDLSDDVDPSAAVFFLKRQLNEKNNIIQQQDNMIVELRKNFETATDNASEAISERFKLEDKLEKVRTELFWCNEAKRNASRVCSSAGNNEYSSAIRACSSRYRQSPSSNFSNNSPNIYDEIIINDIHTINSNENVEEINLRKRYNAGHLLNSYQTLENTHSDDDLKLDNGDDDENSFCLSSSTSKEKKKKKKIFKNFYKIFECCAPFKIN